MASQLERAIHVINKTYEVQMRSIRDDNRLSLNGKLNQQIKSLLSMQDMLAQFQNTVKAIGIDQLGKMSTLERDEEPMDECVDVSDFEGENKMLRDENMLLKRLIAERNLDANTRD